MTGLPPLATVLPCDFPALEAPPLLAIHCWLALCWSIGKFGERLVEYWLIDIETGNGQGCYGSTDQALRAVVDEIQANGGQHMDTLGLIAIGGYAGAREIWHGTDLAKRALQRYPLLSSAG